MPGPMDYLDFEVEIGPRLDQRATARRQVHNVAVLRAPEGAGEPRAEMTFPLVGEQRELQLLRVQNALLRSTTGAARRVSPSSEQPIQDFGTILFNALFDGAIGSCYDFARRTAESEGKGLRHKLRIQDPALAALPWEFLYDPRGSGSFLALSPETPLIRYVEVPRPIPTLAVEPPLRVLGVVASPSDLPQLDVALEKHRLEKSLHELAARGEVELTWLEGQTWQDLRTAMWGGPWHIFHFIGHGDFDATADEGVIALADDQGHAQLLTATQLSRLLAGQATLRLALLNSCDGAKGSNRDLFSSTAVTLVSAGISAVVGMQYEISDVAAIEFGSSFYNAIAHGIPVDAAVAEARIAISMSSRDTAEWGIPVLHMRTPTGRIFDIKTVRTPPPQPAGVTTIPVPEPAVTRVELPPPAPAADDSPRPVVDRTREVAPPEQRPAPPKSRRTLLVAAGAAVLLIAALALVGRPLLGGLAPRPTPRPTSAATATTGSGPQAASACAASGSTALRCTVLANLAGQQGAVWGLSFSNDGTRLLSGGYEDPPAIVWEAPSGNPAALAQKLTYRGNPAAGTLPPPIVSVAWSPSSQNVVATGAVDGTVHVWEVEKGQDTFTPAERANSVLSAVAWDAAGKYVAGGSWDGSLRVWAPGGSSVANAMPSANAGRVYALTWTSSDTSGGVVAAGVQDGRILLWDTRTRRNTAIAPDGKAVEALAWSTTSGVLASGTEDGVVHTWIQQSGANARLTPTHDGAVHSVAWSADGKLLASGGDDGVVKLWQWTNDRATQIGEINEKRQAVFALAWSPRPPAGVEVLAIGRQDHQVELVQVTR